MPKQKVIEKAKELEREGKSPSTQAGEFVREEIEQIRKGVHGARSAKQAIAIGLSEARRAGVKLPPPKKGKVSEEVREKAQHELEVGKHGPKKPSPTRSKAALEALQKETTNAASHLALSRHAKAAARKRTGAQRSESAKKAAETRTEGKS